MTDERLDPKSPELGVILMIDAMAKRYGRLPTEIMRDASTFDLVIMDAAFAYEAQQMNKDKVPDVPVEDLQAIIESTR